MMLKGTISIRYGTEVTRGVMKSSLGLCFKVDNSHAKITESALLGLSLVSKERVKRKPEWYSPL